MSILDWFARRNRNTVVEREKLDIPGNLWVKCISCGGVLYSKELETYDKVCPHCNHHFRLTCTERLEITADPNSFKEINANIEPYNFLKFKDTLTYDDRIKKAKKRTKLKEAVITGSATINKIPVMLVIMDFGFLGGSMGSAVGEKITRAVEAAVEQQLPVVIMSSSGGARMQEGVMSLMQMAKTSAAIHRLKSAGLFYISVLCDPTTGGTTASFAMLGDLNLAEPNALIGFAGPRVIEQTIRQKLPKGFQRSEYLKDHGMVDHICERKDLKNKIGLVLEYAGYKKIEKDEEVEPVEVKDIDPAKKTVFNQENPKQV